MITSLKKAGFEVIECHEPLWGDIEHRVNLVKYGPSFSFIKDVIRVYSKLFIKFYRLRKSIDLVIVGYPGQFDIFLAWFLARITKKPLILDFFMSIYLISKERRLDKRNPLIVSLLRLIEFIGLRLPDMVIQDTNEYKKWCVVQYKLSSNKIRLVPTSADDIFYKERKRIKFNGNEMTVVYYGTFIPNHGTTIIIEAANILSHYKQKNINIKFIMIGSGPDLQLCKDLVKKYQLKNVNFIDWMAKEDLIEYISLADICLGAFGSTPQSLMTIHNKIYECLAMGKPVITGISPATNETFNNFEDIILCQRNSKSLAEAILTLYFNPDLREKLSKNAQKLFAEKFSTSQISNLLFRYINEITK